MKKTLGLYIFIRAAILAVVAVVLYGSVMYTADAVRPVMIAVAVVACAAVVLAFMGKTFANFLAIVATALAMLGLGLSVGPMVNEIGLVYAGLNPYSNVAGFVNFAVVAAIIWVLALIGTFCGLVKKIED